MLVDTFPEVSETFIAEEIRALRRAGATVDVEALGPARTPDPAAAAEIAVRVAAADTRGARLRAVVPLVAAHPCRALRDVLDRRRWRAQEHVLPLRAIAPIARAVRGRGTRHLHAHFGAGAGLTALRLSRLLGLPYSITLHGYDIFLTPMNLAEKLEHAAFATSGSAYTVGALRAAHPAAASRIHEIVMGVDTDTWRRTTPEREDGLVVAVGRLVDKKGLTHLLDAVGLLRGDPVFGRLLVIGDGPLRESLAAQAVALDIAGVVTFAGAQPTGDVLAAVERAAVVAIPAVIAPSGDRDSMPVIAKEALALEVPVVASDVAGLPEVVRPPWGTLVPPGDPAALATALRDVLAQDPDQRAANGRAGRAYVATACSVDTEARRLLDLVAAVA